MAQSLQQLKVHFFVNLYSYFVTSLNDQNISSIYQIIQNCINDAINIL